jgi:hypothetical protein
MIKSGNWEMVMEVFQVIFNAYSSLVMMYGWWFNEKKKQELEGFDDIKNLNFQASLMEFLSKFVDDQF